MKILPFLIILAFFLAIFATEASAAGYVCCSTETITFHELGHGYHWGFYSNTANLTDGDLSTKVGGYSFAPAGYCCANLGYRVDITLDELTDLETIEFTHEGYIVNEISWPWTTKYLKTSVFYGGAWHQIDNRNPVMGKQLVIISSGASPWPAVSQI